VEETAMSEQTAAASASRRMISVGFDAGWVPAGTHMCLVYGDDDEYRWMMARFVQSGLEGNELVNYLADGMTPDQCKEWMRKDGVTLPDELDRRQLALLDAGATYCPDGTFKIDRCFDNWTNSYQGGLRKGYVGARGTGEMTWATKGLPGSENLVEYESRVNVLVRTVPMTFVCQYDARRFDGATLYSVLRVHPMTIVQGQVVRNPYYVEPEVFLAKRAARSEV
jgi:hypothetical protein